MGRASRAKQAPPAPPGLAPGATRVTCTEVEYLTLRLAIRYSEAVAMDCQARLTAAIATRDAALKAVMDPRGLVLTPGMRIDWEDPTREFVFSDPTQRRE